MESSADFSLCDESIVSPLARERVSLPVNLSLNWQFRWRITKIPYYFRLSAICHHLWLLKLMIDIDENIDCFYSYFAESFFFVSSEEIALSCRLRSIEKEISNCCRSTMQRFLFSFWKILTQRHFYCLALSYQFFSLPLSKWNSNTRTSAQRCNVTMIYFAWQVNENSMSENKSFVFWIPDLGNSIDQGGGGMKCRRGGNCEMRIK